MSPPPALIGESSRSFAWLAARIYAANGIRAHLVRPEDPEATLTTPELSYAIRRLGAQGGVNLSASHNHPDDNGIKVYDGNGGQFAPPDDDRLTRFMTGTEKVSLLPREEAVRSGLIAALPEDVVDEYVTSYRDQFLRHCGGMPPGTGPVVYTPLCGSGERTVARVLRSLGVEVVVPDGHGPDGTFAAVPFVTPNPELPAATVPAFEVADRVGSSLVLSSDPDADRIGVDIRAGGEWRHLDGNQIASVLAAFLIADPDGPRLRGLVLHTLVTTGLVGTIARAEGCEVRGELLVGFKYVGQILNELEAAGNDAPPFVLAAEESHGVLTTTALRDKDAVSAAIYLPFLHRRLAERGQDLLEYYAGLLRTYGLHAQASRSVVLRGGAGVRQIDDLMDSLRAAPPATLLGEPVISVTDHRGPGEHGPISSEGDRQSRNVLQWRTRRVTVLVRPSGTEPKVKMYLLLGPGTPLPEAGHHLDLLAAVESMAAEAAADIYAMVLDRLGRSLSPAAAALPDLLDLDQKERFDTELVPDLRERLRADDDAVAAWLAGAATRIVPADDPLTAIGGALRRLLRDWPAGPDRERLAAVLQPES